MVSFRKKLLNGNVFMGVGVCAVLKFKYLKRSHPSVTNNKSPSHGIVKYL